MMKIIIKIDEEGGKERENIDLILSDEEYDNHNYVEMRIGTEVLTVPVEAMATVFKVFNEKRKEEEEKK